jgi:succinoglycan biosynthesis protein ExoO
MLHPTQKRDSASLVLPRVTVIIAAYRAAICLERAIVSALSQSGVDLEVIVIDDGSNDATSTLAASLVQQDPRLNLIQFPENRGPAAARNAGFDVATGDWIAILDSDDVFMPRRLEQLVAMGISTAADLVADNFYVVDRDLHRVAPAALALLPATQILSIYDFVNGARPYASEPDFGLLKPIFRRSFLEKHHLRYPADLRHGEDFDLVFTALLYGAKYTLNRTPFYLYTSRSSGLSKTILDYGTMIRRTESLASAARDTHDRRLCYLLEKRAMSLRDLQTESRLSLHRSKRQYWQFIKTLVLGRGGLRWMIRSVQKKIWS